MPPKCGARGAPSALYPLASNTGYFNLDGWMDGIKFKNIRYNKVNDMVRELHIILSDEEYEKLSEIKDGRCWKDMLLPQVPKSREEMITREFAMFEKKVQPYLGDEEYILLEAFRTAYANFICGRINKVEEVINIINRICGQQEREVKR